MRTHKMKFNKLVICIALGLSTAEATLIAPAAANQVQSYDFNYQSYLEQNGQAANRNYDLEFSLWDAETDGTQFGSTISEPAWPIIDGFFNINLS